jgi:hypothetical protein
MNAVPFRFIGEAVEPEYDRAPALEKKPGLPERFVWRGETHEIVELVSEWHDYGRRGRAARNVRPERLAAAVRRGSWGVGRDYYRVRTDSGRVFDLYYDRAPKGVRHRKGSWTLFREMVAEE